MFTKSSWFEICFIVKQKRFYESQILMYHNNWKGVISFFKVLQVLKLVLSYFKFSSHMASNASLR